MANKAKFFPRKVSASLTVAGVTITDVVAVTATFELNGIPIASVDLAAGVNMKTGSPSSASSGTFDGIPLRSPATVTLTVFPSDDGEQDPGLPAGTYVIFEGYYIGTGWTRTREEAHFQVHLIHWIDDLNCSSMINGNYSPGMPGDLANAAIKQAFDFFTDDQAGISAKPFINNANPFDDIWQGNLKPALEKLANMSHFKRQTIGIFKSQDSGNDEALKALMRMPCTGANAGNVGTKLNTAGDVNEPSLKASFRYSLTELIVNNMGYTSFWAKLIGELCPEFLLAISPAVSCANVIPFFGGLSTPHVTISADEYNVARFNCHATNLIESVNLFHSMHSSTGIGKPGATPAVVANPDFFVPFGQYPKGTDRDRRGFIMVKRPPRWLANAAPMGAVVSDTATFLQQDAHTGSRNNSRQPPAGKIDGRSGQATFKSIADRYCEHWYKTSVLAQRQGELSGKLRFDIAPGSIVEIKLPATSTSGGGPKSYFAAVMSVSYVINSERPAAGTSFTFTAMRTESENSNPFLTSSVAPLYTSAWSGGPLIQ
jgi:hypothetical protein